MIEFTLDDPTLEPITLEPEKRTTMSGAVGPYELEGWVSLGVPAVAPITKARTAHDPDLKQFLENAAAGTSFFLVHLSCSFNAPEAEPFSKAWVRVLLTREDGQPANRPVAWSMQPDRLLDAVEYTHSAKLGTELKLAPVKISTSLGEGVKMTKKEISLQAFNELQSNPLWEFQRTAIAAISGKYRLVLVVKASHGGNCIGTVQLYANVKKKKWGLVRYEDAFPTSPHRTFRFG